MGTLSNAEECVQLVLCHWWPWPQEGLLIEALVEGGEVVYIFAVEVHET